MQREREREKDVAQLVNRRNVVNAHADLRTVCGTVYGTVRWQSSEESEEEAKLLIYLAAPQGFEPRYADPESAVLPLNEGAKQRQQNAALMRCHFHHHNERATGGQQMGSCARYRRHYFFANECTSATIVQI